MDYINEYVLEPFKEHILVFDFKTIAFIVLSVVICVSIYWYYMVDDTSHTLKEKQDDDTNVKDKQEPTPFEDKLVNHSIIPEPDDDDDDDEPAQESEELEEPQMENEPEPDPESQMDEEPEPETEPEPDPEPPIEEEPEPEAEPEPPAPKNTKKRKPRSKKSIDI